MGNKQMAPAGGDIGNPLAPVKTGLEILDMFLPNSPTTTEGSRNVSTTLTPEMEELLASIATSQARGAKEYTPEKAAEASNLAFDQALRQTLEQYMPGIAGKAGASGLAGGGTTADMLQSDLATRAAQAASGAKVDALTKYGQLAALAAQTATAAASQTAKETKEVSKSETSPEDNLGSKLSSALGDTDLAKSIKAGSDMFDLDYKDTVALALGGPPAWAGYRLGKWINKKGKKKKWW